MGLLSLAFRCIAISKNGKKTLMWQSVGKLLTPRYAHRSIVINNSIMHIGGAGGGRGLMSNFEQWTPGGKKGLSEWHKAADWKKETLQASLDGYVYYPESFVVSDDFC